VRRPAAAARARPVGGGQESRARGCQNRLESDLVPVGRAVNVWSENDDLHAGRCEMESGWSLSNELTSSAHIGRRCPATQRQGVIIHTDKLGLHTTPAVDLSKLKSFARHLR
jgi:hypothetical protein